MKEQKPIKPGGMRDRIHEAVKAKQRELGEQLGPTAQENYSLATTVDAQIHLAKVKGQFTLSIVLACGGMCSMIIGFFVVLVAPMAQGESFISAMGIEVTSKGFGAVVMATSVFWGFLSYLTMPQYRSHISIEDKSENDLDSASHKATSTTTISSTKSHPTNQSRPY